VSARWDSLPAVTIVNPISEVRPGGTVLLSGSSPDLSEDQVVLAFQRYGRGKSIALTVQDTWLWQMIPALEDQSHETFWKQVLRWLIDGVPESVQVITEQEQVEPGESVRLVVTVGDSTYIEVNDASVTARITSPSGLIEEVAVEWSVERDGEYVVEFRPSELGAYEVEVTAERDGMPLGSDLTYLHTAPSDEEHFGASRHTQTLRRIAEETGGQYYTPDNIETLPEDITITGAGVTLVEQMPLWDMPIIFLLMLTLMGAEWGFRRMRGLV